MPRLSTEKRKNEHLDINAEQDVSFQHKTTGLEHYTFIHQALPEIDIDDVDTTTSFLEHKLSFPLMIASVTGGSKKTGDINLLLAETAQDFGIGMGLGSMRAAFEDVEVTESFKVRSVAPDILLFANLGAVQLNYGYGVDVCKRAVEIVGADGLILHLNPMQECLQPEGNNRFKGLLHKIEEICVALEVPVIVKEVGFGLSGSAANSLIQAGVTALDIAGAGGTSWSRVEMYRAEKWIQREVAASFCEWGIPTAESLLQIRKVSRDIPLIASGGLKTGIDIAKVLALGADIASIAGPILRYAVNQPDRLHDFIEVLYEQFRIAMFTTGTQNVSQLRNSELLVHASANPFVPHL